MEGSSRAWVRAPKRAAAIKKRRFRLLITVYNILELFKKNFIFSSCPPPDSGFCSISSRGVRNNTSTIQIPGSVINLGQSFEIIFSHFYFLPSDITIISLCPVFVKEFFKNYNKDNQLRYLKYFHLRLLCFPNSTLF